MIELKLDMPDFKNEAEQAAWWPTQEDEIFEAVEEARRNGTLKIRRASEKVRALPPATPIRLEAADLELAKSQAQARGVEYQAYLAEIVHEALHKAS